jgi:hypothetical protein
MLNAETDQICGASRPDRRFLAEALFHGAATAIIS